VLAIEGLLAVDTIDSKVALPQLGTGTRVTYAAMHHALQQVGCGTSSAVIVKVCAMLYRVGSECVSAYCLVLTAWYLVGHFAVRVVAVKR
jgi:hypothetical protein